ncbi:MAG: peptidoglycan DD-metalloendopeptidase family protein [Cyanobacteriota bacterium]
MKRPFTHKIKSVPSCAADKDAKANLSAGKLSGGESGLLKPISPEVNRRARTSAAMIGLAISMGTSSLLLPQQGDEAKAADPVAAEPSVSNAPGATDIAVAAPASKVEPETTSSVAPSPAIKPESKSVAASPKVVEPEVKSVAVSPKVEPEAKAESKPAPRVIEHKVQQRQTIWQSKNYQVEPAAIATSNNIKSSSVLPAGQVVKIPSVNGTVHEVKPGDTVEKLSSESYGVPATQVQQLSGATTSDGLPVDQSVTIPGNVNELLKARQDAAMSRLKEQRGRLQNSLTQLRSEESTKVSAGQLKVTEPAQIDNPEAAEVEIAAPRVLPVVVQTPGENAPNQVINQLPSAQPRNIAVQMPGENVPNQVINQLSSAQPRNIAVQMPGENAPNRVINHLPSAQTREALEASPQEPVGVNQGLPISVPTLATKQALPIQTVAPAPIAVVEPNGVTADVYQVKPGDTLDAIARIHGVSRAELLRANQLDNPNMIRVNQPLKIPQKQTVTLIPGLNAALRQSKSNVAVPNLSVPTLPTTVPLPVAATQVRVQSSSNNVPIVKPVLLAGNPLPIATPSADRKQTQSAGLKQNSEYSTQIEKLREDIIKLRQQYRSQQIGDTANSQNVPVANISVPVTPASVPVAPVVNNSLQRAEYSTPINPEFSPNRYNEAVQAEMQKRQRQQQRSQAAIEIKVPPPAAPRARTRQSLVAAAPAGADTYNPTLRPPFGQQVSPELPPLPGPNPYLPDSPGQFNGYIWPSKGVLTSGYGRRWGRMHKGIDIAAPVGTPVVAAAPGVVVYARWNSGGYGNLVDIKHADGTLTRYAHNNRLLVREGEAVEQGQQISEMGSTGRSTGPHLHFELHSAGKGAINPIALLPRR